MLVQRLAAILESSQARGRVGMKNTRELGAALERVHGVLERHVKEGSATGAVALVAHGESAQVAAVGEKASGSADPMQRDTIFRIASLTKPITTTAAMMLIDEGKLRLDEPIDRVLPELARPRVLKRLALHWQNLFTPRFGVDPGSAAASRPPMNQLKTDL
jgi:CubicO group peptidase (beta-lactamase class C family)